MSTIDPNRFASLAPLTPRELLDKIGTLQEASAKATSHAAGLKAEAKAELEAAEGFDAKVLDLVRCFRMNRPVFALVDGEFTTETPKGLDLWEASGQAATRERTQAEAATYVEPIHEHFGVGRVKERAFVRTLKTDALAAVWAVKGGEWRAAVGGVEVPGAPWRSAAEAMLASLTAAKSPEDEKTPELGWNQARDLPQLGEKAAEPAKADAPKAEPKRYLATYKGRRLSVTLETDPDKSTGWRARCATGEDVVHEGPELHPERADAMGHALAMAGYAETDPRPEWTPDAVEIQAEAEKPKPTKTRRPAAGPHDGKTFRATWGERSLSVAQVVAPGPWFAYVDGQRIGGEAGFPTAADAERSAEANLALPVGSSLGWIEANPSAPVEAPKAPASPAATPPASSDDAPAPRRRTRAAAAT